MPQAQGMQHGLGARPASANAAKIVRVPAVMLMLLRYTLRDPGNSEGGCEGTHRACH